MHSIADPARPRRRRRARRVSPELVNVALDGLAIAITLAAFVALLWWMTLVATS